MVARQFFNLSEHEEGGISLQRKRVSAFGAINREGNEDDDDDAANCEENGSLNSESMVSCHLWCMLGRRHQTVWETCCGHWQHPCFRCNARGWFCRPYSQYIFRWGHDSCTQLPETWQHLQARLRPGGRIMVNCGGSRVEAMGKFAKDSELTTEETIAAICKNFPNNLS